MTGANEGVGSYAIALLAARGYHVVAATGRPQESAFLERLGAADIIDCSEFSQPGKSLAMTHFDGLVAACGLARGMEFPATVPPFILRGISLPGINSVTRPAEERRHAWARQVEDIDPALPGEISRDIRLSDTLDASEQLLEGAIRGRLVVDVNG